MKKVSVNGDGLTVLAPVERMSSGGSWGTGGGGTIVYAPNAQNELMAVPQGGGTPTRVAGGLYPQFDPGGETVVYSWQTGDEDGYGIVSLSSLEDKALGKHKGAKYLPSGHVLYPASLDALSAQPFDLATKQTRGEAIIVLEDVVIPPGGQPFLSVSESGTLAYVSGTGTSIALAMVDREGNATPLVSHDLVHAPRFSPDGTTIAYDTQPDIWSYDLERGTRARLTVDFGQAPAWSPDGTRLAFHSDGAIYGMPADASTAPEMLLSPIEDAAEVFEASWSHEGRTLIYVQNGFETGYDIWFLVEGSDPQPFLATSSEERAPRFSPDDHFVAYVSDDSGRNEIYVRPFRGPGARWPISAAGGTEPVWSPDGKELFYRHGRDLMVVDVDTSGTFRAGRPRRLLSGDFRADLSGHPAYDVSPDGMSFVMIEEMGEPLDEIHIVLNWFEELNRLVPTEH